MISLEKLCLNLIVQEFEKFHCAFSISDDEVLKRNFKFLQRVYTSVLLTELSQKRRVEKYFDFLLNEHLEFLDKKWFKFTHQDLIKDHICHLPNLKRISLGMVRCTDEILEKIAKFCPKINEINLSYNWYVSDFGVKYLCKNESGHLPCPDLKTLFLRGTSITSSGIEYLIQNLPTLEKLVHEDVSRVLYSIHKDCKKLEALPNYNLTYLDFSKCTLLPYFTDLVKVCLKLCPKLKTVSFVITDREQQSLINDTRFEELKISSTSRLVPKIDIDNFFKNAGSNLVFLSLDNCSVTINVLAKSCPSLKYLILYNCDFTYVDDGNQFIFRFLTHFRLQKKIIDRISIEAMNSIFSFSPRLENVLFFSCDFSSFTEKDILKFCEDNSLKVIRFADCKLGIRIVKGILSSCSILESLSLDECDDYNDYHSEIKDLREFAKTLANQPKIHVKGKKYFDEYDDNIDIEYFESYDQASD